MTNIDLAQSIIARYTHFLSMAAPAADLTLLEPPAPVLDQENPTLQWQEIRHIHNCIEQNTMVSVNLNLQFLNQMITRVLTQIGKENRQATQMLQRTLVMDSTTQPGSIRIDAPATQILLRELLHTQTKEVFRPSPLPFAPPSPAQALLRRSLTQLVTPGTHPVLIEYPAPAVGGDANAMERPMVRSLEPPQMSLSDSETHSVPIQPPKALPLLHPVPPQSTVEARDRNTLPASASPTPVTEASPRPTPQRVTPAPSLQQGQPALTPVLSPVHPNLAALVHPATPPPPQSGTVARTPSLPQSPEAPPPTPPATLVHPAAEAPPSSAPLTPTAVVHPAAEVPPQPHRVSKTPPLPQPTQAPPLSPIPTALVHPAAEAPPPSHPVLKTPPLPQPTQAPPLSPIPTALVHPAAEAPPPPNPAIVKAPALPQPTQAPPLSPIPTTLVHPAAKVPSQPSTIVTLTTSRQPVTPALLARPSSPSIGQHMALPPSGTPLPAMGPEQASMVHPGMAAAKGTTAARESIAARLNPTHKVTRIYRKGMAPSADSEPQAAPEPLQLSHIAQRNDTPVSRVLRNESRPSPQSKSRESFQPEEDTVDIPTVRVSKKTTQKAQPSSTSEHVAINAPQEHTTTLFTQQPELSEAELIRITNQVYRALENRLHNEKMRRGMW